MSAETDLAIIAEQESKLVFDHFNEDVAVDLGLRIRVGARAFTKGVAVGIYLWDRTVFYGATAGATEGNRSWIERKVKLVKLQLKSSYRVVVERGDKPRQLEPGWGLAPSEYALAGGAFPIVVKGIGIVGAAAASGLHERDDHEIVRAAIAELLGHEPGYLALPAQ
jgi:uncharacterized protein (UPF0303 family)